MREKTTSKKSKPADIALKVEHVSKSFRLPTEQASGIKQAFINWTRGVKGYKEQHVLKDISFTVEKGDFFGIVGRNGSGKSTLLKLISQIYLPDSGKITVNGKLVPFIELGVGFNPELTGRENVYLNGALLGFSHEEVSVMYEDIVKFAELEEFMDQKLKNYSSGMQVRLAFSIAIKADADILVLDEVLAVGDEAFQRKCFQYFARLKKMKKTVILVTHSMEQVQQFCNKAALIDKGHKLEVGNPAEISQIYKKLNMPEDVGRGIKGSEKILGSQQKNISFSVNYRVNEEDDLLEFSIEFLSKISIDDAVFTFVINRDTGEPVYRWTSDENLDTGLVIKEGLYKRIEIHLQNIFPDGVFSVQIGLKRFDRTEDYLLVDEAVQFEIVHQTPFPADIYWKPKAFYRVRDGGLDD